MALSDVLGFLGKVAPTIAGALGGPLAGLAAEFVAGKLGMDDKSVESVTNAIAGMSGEQLVQMKQIDEDLQKFLATNGIALQQAQIGVNLEEAKSVNLFVAGWRPAVGWVGAIGLAYVAIVEPIARFIANVGFHYTGVFPAIDTDLTFQVISGLVGFGVMRTVDKVKGVGSGH